MSCVNQDPLAYITLLLANYRNSTPINLSPKLNHNCAIQQQTQASTHKKLSMIISSNLLLAHNSVMTKQNFLLCHHRIKGSKVLFVVHLFWTGTQMSVNSSLHTPHMESQVFMATGAVLNTSCLKLIEMGPTSGTSISGYSMSNKLDHEADIPWEPLLYYSPSV